MKIRADIAAMLHAGHTQANIVRTLHVSTLTVQKTREAIGRPSPHCQPIAEMFAARTAPVNGGHVRWSGYVNGTGTPMLSRHGREVSAYRVAFEAHYGRSPVGLPKPGCGFPRCVAGAHLEDRPMREKNREVFAAIFGEEGAR